MSSKHIIRAFTLAGNPSNEVAREITPPFTLQLDSGSVFQVTEVMMSGSSFGVKYTIDGKASENAPPYLMIRKGADLAGLRLWSGPEQVHPPLTQAQIEFLHDFCGRLAEHTHDHFALQRLLRKQALGDLPQISVEPVLGLTRPK